jgi:O-succinylbenzoic acid--CoA ligase
LIPEQIEEKLSHGIHSRFFVGGIADAVFGEKLVLVMKGKSNYG